MSHFLRGFRHSQQINPAGQQHPYFSVLTMELEGWLKFSLNSLTTLFAILAVSGSMALQPVALTLLIYTINLRLTINTCLLHDYPILSRILHSIPLLGTFCTASIALVSNLQSPALAVIGLFLGMLPLVFIAIHQGMLCLEMPIAELPVQMQDVPAPAAPGSVHSTPLSH